VGPQHETCVTLIESKILRRLVNWHLYVLGRVHYRMTLRTAKSDRDVITRSTGFSRWPWKTLRNYMFCVRASTLSYVVAHSKVRSWRQNSFDWFSRWPWNTLRNYKFGVSCCRKEWGKQWTEKESFQRYFYNRYKIVVYTGLRSDCIKNHASRYRHRSR
jgi:hypothetical protein